LDDGAPRVLGLDAVALVAHVAGDQVLDHKRLLQDGRGEHLVGSGERGRGTPIEFTR